MRKFKRSTALFIVFILTLGAMFSLPFAIMADEDFYLWITEGTEEDLYEIESAEDFEKLMNAVNSGCFVTDESMVFSLVKDVDLTQLSKWTPIGTDERSFNGIFKGNGNVVSLSLNISADSEVIYIGLFGYIGGSGVVENLIVDGSVEGNIKVGGIAGTNEGIIRDCVNNASVTGDTQIGGIAGFNGGIIENCENKGEIKGNGIVGGVTGSNKGDVIDGKNYGLVEGEDKIGGIAGNNAFNYGIIQNCANFGFVKSLEKAGGIAGANYHIIGQCFNMGGVTGDKYSGGITGINENGAFIGNCYNTGIITGSSFTGGIAGQNNSSIEKCYNIGRVNDTGGKSIAGNNTSGAVITDCYYDKDVLGYEETYMDFENSSNVAIYGLTTAQMTDNNVLTTGEMSALGSAPWEKRKNIPGEVYYPELNVFINSDYSKQSAAVSVPLAYTISSMAENGGTITPSGIVRVEYNGSQTFTVSADEYYAVADVRVDGVSVGNLEVVTFNDVKADHMIAASFTYIGGSAPPAEPTPLDPVEEFPSSGDNGGDNGDSGDSVNIEDSGDGGEIEDSGNGDFIPDSDASRNDKTTNMDAAENKNDTADATVNQPSLEEQIESGKDNIIIVATGEIAMVQLAIKNIEDITNKEMTLSVQAGNIVYAIPAGAIDTGALMKKFNTDDPSNVTLSITITTTIDPKTKNLVNTAVFNENCELVLPAVSFTVTVSYNGKTYEVTEFGEYVERTIEVTEEQAKKITTAVVIEDDGTVRPVPTNVYKKDGKWYVTISSMTNSVYAVIYYEKTFDDIKGKWYEASVEEMASRKIINGASDTKFVGELGISRAEFCAIVVRALGLPESGGVPSFKDVSKANRYYGAIGIAYKYGIINGRGDGKFDPQTNITWQEAMVMIQRAAKITGYKGHKGNITGFADRDQLNVWAVDAAKFFAGSSLLSDNNDGSLNPLTDITRAETADVILKLLRKSKLIDIR